ncbi:lecithin retinol acyltransferase family protein [Pseudomonas sp. A-B-19]|uniref:lecithin retinol acyltransferase family protein n=1 Tax=Pseudomonas sp. A-B-19 TaxID=2832405 RepID=UPI001CBB058A|nr:lecithin retinol acyltransferase family protein [Pseudomonas sp. A-B-19]
MSTLANKLKGELLFFWSAFVFCLMLVVMDIIGYLKVLIVEFFRPAEQLAGNELPKISFARPLIVLQDNDLEFLPIGSHLISPRTFYLHHGIYLGFGEVAHYSGFSGSFKPGPVEVSNLAGFANGKPVWVLQEPSEYSKDEIVSRARSRVGENQYRILTNNCEHFCSWCLKGKSCSTQVRVILRRPYYLLSLVAALELKFIA